MKVKKLATSNFKEEDGKYFQQYFSVEYGMRNHYLKFYWIEMSKEDYLQRYKEEI